MRRLLAFCLALAMAAPCLGARYFDSTDKLKYGAAIASPPFSVCCWVKPDNITARSIAFAMADEAGSANYFLLRISGDIAGDPIRAAAYNVYAETTSGYSAGVWNHACAVFTSNTLRAAYLNGGSKGTNASSMAPVGLDNTTIGCLELAGTDAYATAAIAECALWDVALTDGDVLTLSKRVSPLLVRPDHLVAYWPLVGRNTTEPDVMGLAPMTVTGATYAEHPPMYMATGGGE